VYIGVAGGVVDSVWVKGILFLSRRNPPSFHLHPHIVHEHPPPILSVRIVPISRNSMQRPQKRPEYQPCKQPK
jgi:hypothetical protein